MPLNGRSSASWLRPFTQAGQLVGPVTKIATLHVAGRVETKRLRGSEQLGWNRGMHIAPYYPSMDVAPNSVQGLSRRYS